MNGPVCKPSKDAKFFDYSHFPKHFKTVEETLDTYNDLGYQQEIQFQIAYP